jgi:ATP-dependent Clp protease ATP-binding subunit ClpC
MQLANQEAQRFNHEYIGTELVLLGLVKEGSGVAANVLKNLGIDLRKIRSAVEQIVQHPPQADDRALPGNLPHTPRTKVVIEYAIEEARQLRHNYVGTEHLLLGLIRDAEGTAAQVLAGLGLTADRLRTEVMTLLGLGRSDRLPPAGDGESSVPVLGMPVVTPVPAEPPPMTPSRESKRAILDRHIAWLQRLMETAVAARDVELAAETLRQLGEIRGLRDRLGK